jgi:hypothetical protein
MLSLKNIALAGVLLGGAILIGAQSLLGTVPPWVFYPAFAAMAGGLVYVKGQRIAEHIKSVSANNPAEGRQTIIIYIVMTLVIGIGGYFFIRS